MRIGWVAIALVALGASEGGAMTEAVEIADGRHDFDFWAGSWRIHNRRLRARLAGSAEWDEFEARGTTWPILDGLGNRDEFRTDFWPDFVGMTFRFFDPVTRQWSIYWADSKHGTLEPPVVGSFAGDVGTFYGDDVFQGRPIRVRFIWTRGASPRWEQAFSTDGGKTWETNWTMDMTREGAPTRESFGVVELRRYRMQPGGRERFARYFDAYFPEAFQALGAFVFGQFEERADANRFCWLRGFADYDSHGAIKSAFYDGPLWREQAARANGLIEDSDDVLLLRPLRADRGVRVLPAVDVVTEIDGPRGIAVAQIFGVSGDADAFAARAETAFTRYREAGAREAGLLVTLDRPNNFPRHPIRADGPFVVWLGVVPDEAALAKLRAAIDASAPALASTGALRGTPETVVLDPTPRSRLRWRAE
jgi:hypothetical protein